MLALTASCSASRAASPVSKPPESAVPSQQVETTVVSPDRAVTLRELFNEALLEQREGRSLQAAGIFDRIVELEPQGPISGQALLQAGLSYEKAEILDTAAERFERLASGAHSAEMIEDALVRTIRVRLHLGQWDQAGRSSKLLLERFASAPPLELIVARAGAGLALMTSGQAEPAAYQLAKGLSIVERLGLDRAGRIPRDLAILYFALGESRRLRGENTILDPDPAHFSKSLERRCEQLLEAQSAYSDAMRAYDAHWSTLSGIRVGELYERLHGELLKIPPPREVNGSDSRLFEGAMRVRYSVLLGKALNMVEHTVAMAESTGGAPLWLARARQLQVQLQKATDEEQRVLNSLPYSRTQLQAALKALATENPKRSP